jgi:hypothetical protein
VERDVAPEVESEAGPVPGAVPGGHTMLCRCPTCASPTGGRPVTSRPTAAELRRRPELVAALQRQVGNRAASRAIAGGASEQTLARLDQDLPYVGAWLSVINPVSQAARLIGRPLSDAEKGIVEPIFGASLSTSVIRINPNSLASFGGCYRTTGNIINLPGTTIGRKSLIHECAHVWQSQNGIPAAYAVSALTAQAISQLFDGDWRKAYDYTPVLDRPWREWNAEQQADWIEDHERLPGGWWHGYSVPA